ncbi:unnamed protein product [Caenorhabditis sp. 36 PRJEB53466]|nr:unnamed protein product [Caenorhabditis sp. 36 PRJEB53466]
MMSSMNNAQHHSANFYEHTFLESSSHTMNERNGNESMFYRSRPQTSGSVKKDTLSTNSWPPSEMPKPPEPPTELSLPNYVGTPNDGKEVWGPKGMPKKAAGDVSLSGKQLVPFLIKATSFLPSVKAEGVQLRIRQLEQQIEEQSISEMCIKKLNFVVDAIDRGDYREAWDYYEALQETYKEEISCQNWLNGLRLLILELIPRQRPPRIASAGQIRS